MSLHVGVTTDQIFWWVEKQRAIICLVWINGKKMETLEGKEMVFLW